MHVGVPPGDINIAEGKQCNLLWISKAKGPLHMSPVTELARLPGRILWCVHMGI